MMIKYCENCFNAPKSNSIGDNGYFPFLYDNDYECPACKNRLQDVDISAEDYLAIVKISGDKNFIQAMIELKQDDIIEFQSKMNQFKAQLQQQESSGREDNVPKCPHCNSTNIKSISVLNRGVSIAMLGIFSKKINKSFECKNCGYTW